MKFSLYLHVDIYYICACIYIIYIYLFLQTADKNSSGSGLISESKGIDQVLSTPKASSHSLSVFYGSQTGTAKVCKPLLKYMRVGRNIHTTELVGCLCRNDTDTPIA